jgi:very-short-patch-repair endonuclease
MGESVLEFELRVLLLDAGIGGWRQECRCHPRRLWRCDFMWPAEMLVAECEGLGRHQTWQGYTDDCEKYNALELLGFTVLRFTARQIRSGYAVATIKEALDEA